MAQGGFSYLWVLLLVAFMGVGLAVALEFDTTAVQRDRERELIAIGRQFRTAIGSYYELQQVAGRGQYPASLDDLLKDNRTPGIRRHLRRVFVDPMTGKAEWGVVQVNGRIVGVHSLAERTPIKQSGFEAEEMGLAGKKAYAEWLFTYPANLAVQPGSMQNLDALPIPNQTTMPGMSVPSNPLVTSGTVPLPTAQPLEAK
ncbi:MAG: type II secretion system protein [Pseudomonadales bacterium]|nr:type II secretion system protein [Pseudomonadales bacterium]